MCNRYPRSSSNTTMWRAWKMFESSATDKRVSAGHGQAPGITQAHVCETEQSRQFGFLRFSTLQDAEVFMEHNYPTLYLYGDDNKSNGQASKARIAFGRERKDQSRGEEPDWICANVCGYRQSVSRICELNNAQCNINNFSTRSRCFRCQAEKPGMDA
jgi:hypothetical protein